MKEIVVDRCENCPAREYDAEWARWACTLGGEPEDRRKEEMVPHDCPLKEDKYEYDQMCMEITSRSVGVWDEQLEGTEEGILLETLWEIIDKYIKIE